MALPSGPPPSGPALDQAVSFPRRFRDLVAEDPDLPAVTAPDGTRTRAELDRSSNRTARIWADLGVTEGSLVTIALGNTTAFVEACMAAWKLGAIPQPVSHHLPVAELAAIVELADPPLVVGVDPASLPGRQALRGLVPDGAAMRDGDPLPDRISPSWKAPTSGGSTGRPKLIVSGDAAVWSDLSARFWRVPSDGKAAVVPGPMYHNGPFMSGLATVLNGGHLVLSERFDAAETLALVEAHQAVWLYLVPTMMSRIWRLPLEERLAFDIKTLETVWHLAAPCPEWLKRAWIEWVGGDVLVELYGGTEGIATTVITGTEYLDHPGSVGKALIGEIAILGPDGEMLPAGEVGDVGMRPPARSGPTYRYVGGDARLIGDWETIGDIGWMDEDGYLFLSDRRSDLILVGGANVYPAEVEAVIDEHPLVRSSAVVGLPDEDLGQRVHAIVQGAPGLTQEDLDAHVRARLARPKCPRSYEFVEEALRDDAGKVRRSALRDERMSR